MLFQSLTTLALAGIATAATPDSFSPASANDLIVSYPNGLALNGINVPKSATQTTPTIGTAQRLNGTFAVMMIDLDIPSATGGPTGTLLHWMQTDLVSADSSTTVNGMTMFELINPGNVAAAAPYFGPSPPNRAPVTHRYTEILVDTTGLASAKAASLKAAGATRGNFSASTVVQGVGAKVVAGNFFQVTSPDAVAGGAGISGNGTFTGSGNGTFAGSGSGNGTTSGGAKPKSGGSAQSNSTVTPGSSGSDSSVGTGSGGQGADQTTPAGSSASPSSTVAPNSAQQVGKGIFLAAAASFVAAIILV